VDAPADAPALRITKARARPAVPAPKAARAIAATRHGRVVVIGQGYVGLPLAMRAVEVGFDVVGFDVSLERVDRLRAATTFVDDVGDDDLADALATGRYEPTADAAALADFDIAVIAVPTPLRDRAPDLGYIEAAARQLAPRVTPGCCVILESTTYPGTTEEIVIPLLEVGSGLRAGPDFHVGYSPERIDPGNPTWQFHNTPKIVSGIDAASLLVVDSFYARLVERTVPLEGIREAELAKLLENTFRHVNIALVNELATYAHDLGINLWSVIDAAATKPFGFMRFTPGPGVGGHCLTIDPSYLSWQVRKSLGRQFRFIELANDVNEHMPDYVAMRVAGRLNRDGKAVNGSRILLIGLAYKPNSGDARESPAIAVGEHLVQLGAVVRAVDPFVGPTEVPAGVNLVEGTPHELGAADLVLVLTDHDSVDWALVETYADRVLDTRNRVTSPASERL
jgi:UDP-N-acetyl-D-mannosaminuronic acid dehydrogenase/UDP-N-acetyl-D-glucosamine dehydrogenase